ncbi:phosphoribosylformylglycinamidine synthase subunit PurQ [Myxococcota bacterium]|nr:phosphoribosylformylglycinamidine synthase subunit PurQ [Myxococcota bacterium]MBU1534436.1 phosphoribosylformylglycinamidine synthase subunit PurQ [Myxococcota bacterium]
MKVNALVLTGNGTNCEVESAYAISTAGAEAVTVGTIWELMEGTLTLDAFNFLCLPGGFLDGDHLGSARAGAHRFAHGTPGKGAEPLMDQIRQLLERGGLIIGICNGFQLLVKLGLLPGPELEQRVTLTHNLSGRFEDRWVTLSADPDSPCVFTRGLHQIELPVRHGEGRLVYSSPAEQSRCQANGLIPLVYVDPKTSLPTELYPLNPNGSPGGAAAMTDSTGRIFGLMPHPEAFTHFTNHPRWTRQTMPEEGAGLSLFKNGISYLHQKEPHDA